MSFLDARTFLIELLEHSLDGVLAVDSQGHIVVWNTAIEQMFGKSKSTVLGHPLFDVLSFLRETGEDWAVREALGGRATTSRDQKFFLPETGREGWYDARYIPLRDANGEIAGVLGVIRDQTDARLALEEVKRESDANIKELRRRLSQGADPRGGAAASQAGAAAPRTAAAEHRTGAAAPRPAPNRTRTSTPGPARTPAPPARPAPRPVRPATPPSDPPEDVSGPSTSIFDPEAAVEAVGDPGVLAELIQDFIVSLPEFVKEMDQAVQDRDYRTIRDHADDVRKAAEALGGGRASRIAVLLTESVDQVDDAEIERGWWRLRRELAVLREALRDYRKSA